MTYAGKSEWLVWFAASFTFALFSLPATYHYNEVAISRHYQKLDATYQGLKLKAQRVSATPHEA